MPEQHHAAVADETSPSWVVEEMKRLARNQHDLANAINGLSLKNVEAMGQQTQKLTELISTTQREMAKDFKDGIAHAETALTARVDKVETEMKENTKTTTDVKLEMTAMKVRMAMWCAIGGVVSGIGGSIITAIIIKAVVHS